MEYIGKYGENFVLLKLLERDIESYMAIKANQEDYDITVVLSNDSVKRVQVKATELQNKNTNNSIFGTEKNYDYLVLVIVDSENVRAFVLTKEEADRERGSAKMFSCSYSESGKYYIKECLKQYENCWDKIKNV